MSHKKHPITEMTYQRVRIPGLVAAQVRQQQEVEYQGQDTANRPKPRNSYGIRLRPVSELRAPIFKDK